MKINHLTGVCLFCGKLTEPYDPNESRFCCTKSLARGDVEKSFGKNLTLYPTIYPIPANMNGVLIPPHPATRPAPDVFAISNDPDSALTLTDDNCLPTLPYPENSKIDHLRCGNATIHNLGDVATNFSFQAGKVTVCDMTTYLWSNTLKDPRSWAVIRTALTCGIRHLGVWTAGNAGLSLAKLAYAVNRLLPTDQRINVYCYGVRGELPVELQQQLQEFRAHVAIFNPARGKIFPPQNALDRLNSTLAHRRIDKEDYWDVSDGWDGVALYMYRLIGRQICKHLKPRYIVAPVGTGDIFFGLYLGRRDCLDKHFIGPNDCRLIAAVPKGANIIQNYKSKHLNIRSEPPARGIARPVSPKVATTYTPLLLVMYEAFLDQSVTVVEVSKEEQEDAAELLIAKGTRPLVASEPSALLAFAALPGLAKRHLDEEGQPDEDTVLEADADVLVVNTGCGALGKDERKFIGKFMGRAGAA